MILNTTNSSREDPRYTYFNVPMDTKYLYAEKQSTVKSPSTAGIPATSDNDQSGGFGLEELISQREEIILAKARLLLSEIYQRGKLREENLYQISVDQCTCRNLIYLLEDNPLDKRRIELERQIRIYGFDGERKPSFH